MDRRERERILRESGVGDPGPRERARAELLAEDLDGSPLRGRPLRRRLRNFRPDVETYVTSLGGPLPYMQRLREIESLEARHEEELRAAYESLARECAGDSRAFARRWREHAARARFDEVNELIARHNRFFPIEARLPMDPKTGDYALVGGRTYRRTPLGEAWVLERFPPAAGRAAA